MKKIILSLLVALMATTGANAQETLTVFDGTAGNSYIPMCGYFFDNYTKSECIIPASELTAMKGGTITAITFYAKFVDESSSTFDPANQKVFLKEVSETTLDLSSDMTDATEVFDGLLSMPTTNPDGYTITFSKGYTYNGGNLLIGVYNDTKGSWNTVTWYGIGNQSSRVSAYGYNPNSLETVSLSSAQTFLPKTTFTYTPAPAGPTTSGITWNVASNSGTFAMPAYDVEVNTELWYKLKQDGTTPAANKSKTDVFLERTLSNSMWSTFCAPFDAAIPDGWTVKEFTGSDYNASTQTLTLDFSTASSIVKGTPYLVKADVDGPTFDGVTQDWTTTHEVTATGGYATFVPVLIPTTINGKGFLYLGGNNTLYYPSGDVNVNGFRAYFKLNNGLTAGEPASARAFVLNLGDEETGIQTIAAPAAIADGGTYSLDGRKVQNTTRKGIYIVNGKKVVIK